MDWSRPPDPPELQGADAYRLTIENLIDGEWLVTSVQRYRRE